VTTPAWWCDDRTTCDTQTHRRYRPLTPGEQASPDEVPQITWPCDHKPTELERVEQLRLPPPPGWAEVTPSAGSGA
jgi:hypothetical protein